VIARLNAEVNKALKDADTIARLRDEGSEPRGGSAADLATFIKSEHALGHDRARLRRSR
jgi:tripartite-type tricarboxylate transporter receptor subunit TctC